MSLSRRRARNSGLRRNRATSSRRPARIPACGPPSSLSPLKETRSTPAARLSETQRLVDAEGAQVDDAAAAQIFVDRDTAFAAECRQFA